MIRTHSCTRSRFLQYARQIDDLFEPYLQVRILAVVFLMYVFGNTNEPILCFCHIPTLQAIQVESPASMQESFANFIRQHVHVRYK